MYQTMIRTRLGGGGEEEEVSVIDGMAATACNEAQQRCVDLAHRNLSLYWLLVVEWFNGQWIYYAAHRPPQITRQTKTRNDESDAVGKLAKSGFSCAESGTQVYAAGLPEFLLWKSFFVCHWLRRHKYIFLKLRFRSRAHVRTLQPSS